MDGAIPIIFQAGQNCTTVVVPIVDDEFWESDMFFESILNSTCNSTTITQNNAAVLIKDDDGMFVSDDVSYITFNYICSSLESSHTTFVQCIIMWCSCLFSSPHVSLAIHVSVYAQFLS